MSKRKVHQLTGTNDNLSKFRKLDIVELPWNLVLPYLTGKDLRVVLCLSKELLNYFKGSHFVDFWKQRIASFLEIYTIQKTFSLHQISLSWTKNWILLKPMAQWHLEDMAEILHMLNWYSWFGGQQRDAGSLAVSTAVHSWPQVYATMDAIPTRFGRIFSTHRELLIKGYIQSPKTDSKFIPTDKLRGSVLDILTSNPNNIQGLNEILSALTNWNFTDPKMGLVTDFQISYFPRLIIAYSDCYNGKNRKITINVQCSYYVSETNSRWEIRGKISEKHRRVYRYSSNADEYNSEDESSDSFSESESSFEEDQSLDDSSDLEDEFFDELGTLSFGHQTAFKFGPTLTSFSDLLNQITNPSKSHPLLAKFWDSYLKKCEQFQ